MYGKLIVITGIDGSGKTLQTGLLYERLMKEGYPAVTVDFPQYGRTFFSDMIARYLRGEFGKANSVNPYLASILFAADRWEVRDEIKTWLQEKKVVVSNRYVCDNMAHQGGKIKDPDERKRFIEWLDRLEYQVFGVPRPDRSILLNVPVEIAYQLVERKEKRAYLAGEKRDIHEGDRDHMRHAYQTFHELVNENWITIECTKNRTILPKEIIAEKVWKAVKDIL